MEEQNKHLIMNDGHFNKFTPYLFWAWPKQVLIPFLKFESNHSESHLHWHGFLMFLICSLDKVQLKMSIMK